MASLFNFKAKNLHRFLEYISLRNKVITSPPIYFPKDIKYLILHDNRKEIMTAKELEQKTRPYLLQCQAISAICFFCLLFNFRNFVEIKRSRNV